MAKAPVGANVPDMVRVDCPHCGQLGRVTGERIIRAGSTLTTYFCDACHTEWDERETDSTPLNLRTREPMTRRDKQTRS